MSRGQLALFQALYRCLHNFIIPDQPRTSVGGVFGVVQVFSKSYLMHKDRFQMFQGQGSMGEEELIGKSRKKETVENMDHENASMRRA